ELPPHLLELGLARGEGAPRLLEILLERRRLPVLVHHARPQLPELDLAALERAPQRVRLADGLLALAPAGVELEAELARHARRVLERPPRALHQLELVGVLAPQAGHAI